MDPDPIHHRDAARLVTVRWVDSGVAYTKCFDARGGELTAVECPASPGIGDVIAAGTKAAGIRPCGRCKQRQAALNKATPSWLKRALAWLRSVSLP